MDSKHFETIRKSTPTKAKLKQKLVFDDAATTIFTKLISKLGPAVLLRLGIKPFSQKYAQNCILG